MQVLTRTWRLKASWLRSMAEMTVLWKPWSISLKAPANPLYLSMAIYLLLLVRNSPQRHCQEYRSPIPVAAVKAATLAQPLPPSVQDGVEPVEESTAVPTSEYPVQSDPTIANAGLTELDAPPVIAITNGHTEADDAGIPQNSGFGDGAANAAAEANWDTNNDLSTSQEWVEVPRDAAETDTGVTATPAAPSNVQSWADDHPESPEVCSPFYCMKELVAL